MNELRAAVAVRDEEDQSVIPLLLQNKPPVVEGREKDELADIELRPEQVNISMCTFILNCSIMCLEQLINMLNTVYNQ